MNVRILREYISMCRFLEVEPTWEGLRKFNFSIAIRHLCEGNKQNTKAGGEQSGGY